MSITNNTLDSFIENNRFEEDPALQMGRIMKSRLESVNIYVDEHGVAAIIREGSREHEIEMEEAAALVEDAYLTEADKSVEDVDEWRQRKFKYANANPKKRGSSGSESDGPTTPEQPQEIKNSISNVVRRGGSTSGEVFE